MVDGIDDVCRRLARDGQDDGRLAVIEAVISSVFDRIENIAEILHPHRRAVLVFHDQRCVLISVEQLIGCIHLPARGVVVE